MAPEVDPPVAGAPASRPPDSSVPPPPGQVRISRLTHGQESSGVTFVAEPARPSKGARLTGRESGE